MLSSFNSCSLVSLEGSVEAVGLGVGVLNGAGEAVGVFCVVGLGVCVVGVGVIVGGNGLLTVIVLVDGELLDPCSSNERTLIVWVP